MNNDKTGGPAFPASNSANVNGTMGMTLLDHFAGLAPPQEINSMMVYAGYSGRIGSDYLKALTVCRYEWASAMIERRERIMNETPEQP